MNKRITVGHKVYPDATFTASQIRSISFVSGVDVIGSELSIDQFTAVVDYEYDDSIVVMGGENFDAVQSSEGHVLAAKGNVNLRELPYGTTIYYYSDDQLYIKAYLKSVTQIGQYKYRLDAISAIGLLDTPKHKGGLYGGTLLTDVLADVIGSGIPYTVDPELSTTQVYGWLPYQSRRKNLHLVMFSLGVAIGRNSNGDMHFHFLSNRNETTIPDGRVYMQGEVSYLTTASAVQVVEHTFMNLPTDETVVEYDNTDGSETANNTLLVFRNAPLHNLQVTGTLTISESNENYAIISGTGSLSGQKYTHSTKAKQRSISQGTENVATVAPDCALINVANSENVMDRVLSYYSSKKTVKAAIVLNGERAGDLIACKDAYNEPITGYISSMSVVVSGIDKATCEVITNYIPTGGGNNFTKSYTYTGTGTINFATLVADKPNDLVQVTLISGGHGGYSGEAGTRGKNGDSSTSGPKYGTAGEGGAGGNGGEGGKVYTIIFHVSDLVSSTVSYSCGAGGLSDLEGGATTCGNWTTADGAIMPYGISDIFSGIVYGAPNPEAGQRGGSGSSNESEGETIAYGGDTWHAGFQGAYASSGEARAWGGYGGGAAVGSNGGDGEDGWASGNLASAGQGGNGANGGTGTNATQYGQGGGGGHGGGGAGIGGADREPVDDPPGSYWYTTAANGYGGIGGAGGQGGAGIILVYV